MQVPSDAHLNKFVTDLLIGHRPVGLIGPDVFRSVSVNKQTDNYAVLNKADWLRRPQTLRAPGENPKAISFSVSSDTYVARNYAAATDVDYETQDNADEPFRPLEQGGQVMRDQLALDAECRIYSKCATGVGSATTLTGGDAWDQFATSDPISNLIVAQEAIRQTTGMTANTAIVPIRVWNKIRFHPDFVKAANPGAGVGGMLTPEQFASIVQVDRVLVPRAVYNSADKGATAAFTDVWSTNVFLMNVGPGGLYTATFGLTFEWTGPKIGRGGVGAFNVMQREDSKRGVTELWTGYYCDEKIVARELGFRIDTGIV